MRESERVSEIVREGGREGGSGMYRAIEWYWVMTEW